MELRYRRAPHEEARTSRNLVRRRRATSLFALIHKRPANPGVKYLMFSFCS
jgi:hypothetical protein